MGAGRYEVSGRYEVYGHHGRRWLIDGVRDSRAAALMRCEELAEDARAGFDLLQVVDAGRSDGCERGIHQQALHRKQAKAKSMKVWSAFIVNFALTA